jgi:hypothetical protein
LGRKDYGQYKIMPTDKKDDGTGGTEDLDNADLANLPFRTIDNVYGLYQPDSIKGYVSPLDGVSYFITANEGDGKDASETGAGDEVSG